MSERTFTESDLRLERAIAMREAAETALRVIAQRVEFCNEEGFDLNGELLIREVNDAIVALSDQPALNKYVAECVRKAVLDEMEWWAKNSIEDTLQSRRERGYRLAAHRAAVESPEGK